jgi:hypothetical protein
MMLGTPDGIIRELEAAKKWELPPQYEAHSFRRLLGEIPVPALSTLSPFTAKQESEIRRSENSVILIHGLPAADLASVPKALESLFGYDAIRFLDSQDKLSETYLKNLDRTKKGNFAVVVPSESRFDASWIDTACNWSKSLYSATTFHSIIFLSDPGRSFEMLGQLQVARERGFREVSLQPWRDSAVRSWLHDRNLEDGPDVRNSVKRATGYWPKLIEMLKTGSNEDVLFSCDSLARSLTSKEEQKRFMSMFALNKKFDLTIFSVAAQLENFSLEDLLVLMEAQEEPKRSQVMELLGWAEKLHIITLEDNGSYVIDSIVRELMNAK